jgi:Flp pilus assembly protein TadD
MSGSSGIPRAYMESMMPRLNYGWSELRALRTSTEKAILAPTREYYDLEHDPNELVNLAETVHPQDLRMERLLNELEILERTDPFSRGEQNENVVGEDTLEALAALGYTRDHRSARASERSDPKDRIEAYEQLVRAQNLIDNGSFTEAKTALLDHVAEHPSSVAALMSLAYAHTELGEIDQARSTYEQILRLDPSHPVATQLLSRVLLTTGEDGRAEQLLVEFLSKQPDFVALKTELCRLYFQTGRPEVAEACFVDALEMDRSLTPALVGLARCFQLRGSDELAHDTLLEALRSSPRDPEVIEELAISYQSRGDLVKAVQLLELLCEIEPDNPAAWNNLATRLAESERFADAAAIARKAASLDPSNRAIRANLGAMLVLSGQLEEGVRELNSVIHHMPDNTFGAELRASALEQLGRYEEARAAWEDLADREPTAGVHAARLQLRDNDAETARTSLREALDRGGKPVRDLIGTFPELRAIMNDLG